MMASRNDYNGVATSQDSYFCNFTDRRVSSRILAVISIFTVMAGSFVNALRFSRSASVFSIPSSFFP